MDLFDRIRQNAGPLGQYAQIAEGYYIFPKLYGEICNHMIFNDKEVIVWSVNNYLGLANHPEVRRVDAESAKHWGLAYPMGSRMMSGNTEKHIQLEKELAEFVQKPAGFLVNYGYQGMSSALDALLSRKDVVVYDSDCHACIVDGVRMHMGHRFVFDHNDMASLEKNLQRAVQIIKKSGGGILVITEGVFGMRGEQGNIRGIVKLKEHYPFRLLVDDAHGFGTLGDTGAGAGEHQGVQDEIDIYFSTFAKSLAGIGAFFAGPSDIIQYLKYNTRSQIFAKSLPLAFVEGAAKRLELLQTHPELKENLWKIANALQLGLREAGFDLGSTNSCVTPIILHGSVVEAMGLVRDLRDTYGIFCSIVVYPVIPKGMMIIRLIPTAAHTMDDVKLTIKAFEQINRKLKKGLYNRDISILKAG